jgi:hypothetical protein
VSKVVSTSCREAFILTYTNRAADKHVFSGLIAGLGQQSEVVSPAE